MRPAQVVPRTSVRLRWLTARTWLAPLLIFSLVFQGLLAQVHIFSHLPFAGGNAGVVANFGATASFTSPSAAIAHAARTAVAESKASPGTAPDGGDELHCPICLALSTVASYVPGQAPAVVAVPTVRLASDFFPRSVVPTRATRTPAQPRGPPTA